MKIEGNLVDLCLREIYPAIVSIENSRITNISRCDNSYSSYVLPGFIDAHVHIESSMVTPGAFATAAVRHGTIGTVSDPHEIANVMGIEGVNYMIDDGKKVPFYFWFGAPSCVPATVFESSGAYIDAFEIERLLNRNNIRYLSEMMNFPGVISNDSDVLEKLEIARKLGKPIDGHAPGIRGSDLIKYINSGISTDHECSTIDEALEKIGYGMKILIREGSAARNLEALKPLLKTHPKMIMLCSDDIHPEMLIRRHINKVAGKLISEGFDLFDVISACSINPKMHYGLDAGTLRIGDPADFIISSDLEKMDVIETWIKGEKVFDGRAVLFNYVKGPAVNNFNCSPVTAKELEVVNEFGKLKVIEVYDGELTTGLLTSDTGEEKVIKSNTSRDVLKIVVKDRYSDHPPSVGFINGFGLKQGAFASSVAHDSHNIICVGVEDNDIADCINAIVEMKGGLAVSSSGRIAKFQLRIGGIMSDNSCEEVAGAYEDLSEKVKMMGCPLSAPFMTLSFMALLVIPSLKISDKGLFDVNKFSFTPLFTR
jgi:adenine deaminase